MNMLPRAFRILIVAAISISIPSGDLTRIAVAASSGGRSSGRPTIDVRPPTDHGRPYESPRERLDRYREEFTRAPESRAEEYRIIEDFLHDTGDVTFSRSSYSPAGTSRQWFDNTQRSTDGRSATFLSMPRSDAEFRNIFDRAPTDQDRLAILLAQTPETLRDLQWAEDPKKQGISPTNQHRVSAAEFERFLNIESASVITVIGHNHRGSFKFPDGTAMKLKDMSRLCVAANKVCVFLSCHASKYVQRPSVGFRRSLDYGEAMEIATRLSGNITFLELPALKRLLDQSAQDSSKHIENTLYAFMSAREDKGIRLEYLQIGSGGSILVLIALAIFSDDEDE